MFKFLKKIRIFKNNVNDNCYFCIMEPISFYKIIFGLSIGYETCNHNNSNKIKNGIVRIVMCSFFTLLNITVLNSFAIHSIYIMINEKPKDLLLLLVSIIITTINLLLGITCAISLLNGKYRCMQLKDMQDILSNCQQYGFRRLMSCETVHKLRNKFAIYTSIITILAIFCLIYNIIIYVSKSTLTFVVVRRFDATYCMLYHAVFDVTYALECCIYREMFAGCLDEVKKALLVSNAMSINRLNSLEAIIFDDKPQLENTKKASNIEAKLNNSILLYMRLKNNVTLYNDFMNPNLILSTPGFTGILILINYSLVKFAYTSNIHEDIKDEYIAILILTIFGICSFIHMAYGSDKLKIPVSTVVWWFLNKFAIFYLIKNICLLINFLICMFCDNSMTYRPIK